MFEDKEIELSEDQVKFILENFEKMSLLNLTREAFKDETLDGRTAEGKAVKKLLADQGKEVKTSKYEKMPRLELTEEQKEFIKKSVEEGNSRPIELARIVYNNEKILPNSKEFRTIYEFVKSIDPNQAPLAEEQVEKSEYKSPSTVVAIAGRVNDYVHTGDSRKQVYDIMNLKPSDEKKCKKLMSYMKTPRFVLQASSYDKKIDRVLFESEFVRFTYNKEDVTEEEVTQYISLCAAIVDEARTNRILTHLQNDVELGLLSSDPETRKYSQSLSENINAWRQKIDLNRKTQSDLLEKLTESRAQRLEGKISENASVLPLIELWQNEEKRNQLIDLAKLEKQEDKDEVKRLADYDSVIALIAGQTEEEAGA